MNNISVAVLVALVLIGSFAVQSDAADYYGPNYGSPRRYRGSKYGGYNGYPSGYGWNKDWNKGWNKGRYGRKYW
ncbi:Hypothetical predicted protein [Mytilus galloprovincialis]|uniref:Foot protein-3 n=1 Tax=Mytilus galloprovincialis TaxID=29158 RepID=A0A8B6FH20_MYTGA|nr:Hypothetical predicted protein [Mytilus galloprovincialis]